MDIKITELEQDQRFDRFLRKFFKKYPSVKLGEIYARIRKWIIKINWSKKKDNYRIQLNDIVQIPDNIINELDQTKEGKLANFPLEKIKGMILYEDDNFIFFNKPAWVAMHEWNKHMDDLTMNNFLEKYVKETWIKTSQTFKPAFCFRLDKDTSWIVIAWKNYDSLRWLNDAIRKHIPEKKYLAITKWRIKNKHINLPLKKVFDKKFWKAKVIVTEDWDHAESIVKPLKIISDPHLGNISLAEIQIFTWRMHQIRVHLAHHKRPIIWDLMYWDPVINRLAKKYYKITRQLLHSWKYSFEYNWKKYNIQAPIPEDFIIWDQMRNQMRPDENK